MRKIILMKFLKERNVHSPENSTYQYLEELQAQIEINKGIAESEMATCTFHVTSLSGRLGQSDPKQ